MAATCVSSGRKPHCYRPYRRLGKRLLRRQRAHIAVPARFADAFAQYRQLEDAIRAHDALHGKAVPALAGPTRPLLVAYKEPRF